MVNPFRHINAGPLGTFKEVMLLGRAGSIFTFLKWSPPFERFAYEFREKWIDIWRLELLRRRARRREDFWTC